MLEFDAQGFWEALNRHRIARHMTWRQVAKELGIGASGFSRMQTGKNVALVAALRMARWLDMPLDVFVWEKGGDEPTAQ